MDRQSAIRLIENTFNHPFDEGRFRYFIRNLFNNLDEFKDSKWVTGYIKDSFKEHIKKYKRIGKYEDSDGNKLDIIVVHLRKEIAIERARTMQRNFVATYLKTRGEKDAAIVAYHTDNPDDWRFSFVQMEYKQEVTESGRIRVQEKLTPARQYSFLVGRNEPSHTAQEQIVPVLQDDRINPTIEDLEKAFSIEVVTKQFYLDYKNLFEKLTEEIDHILEEDLKVRKEFEMGNVDTANFAKKLLGQIVFLYFLQKKGWLGVPKDERWGKGNRKFLRILFEECTAKGSNFFNDYLEYLFYEALATTEGRVTIDLSYYPKFNCKIPFLNGGLFEPIGNYNWQETGIFISNDVFAEIFDTFDRYNFTVREDEPLEKEVAVDPEMLGKVFENLLEVKNRKSKGTYYTPREIVHYMCQESLINYLDTTLNSNAHAYQAIGTNQTDMFGNKARKDQLKLEQECSHIVVPKENIETLIKYGETVVENEFAAIEKQKSISEGKQKRTDTKSKLPPSVIDNALSIDNALKNIRVCDPAVGSGAFPVGMMNEIVRTRNALTPHLSFSSSVIVSEAKQSRTIYDFKRHCIQNCLYGVDIDSGAVEIAKLRLWLSLVVDEEDIKQINPLPNLDYKIVCGNSLLGVEKNLSNWQQFNKLEELKPLFFDETNVGKKHEYKNQIEELISQITNGHKDFDFEVYFSEVFHEKKGFDVVIANPPYGANIDDMIRVYAKLYPNTTKSYKDIYKLFIELGMSKVVATHGVLCYIIPNTLLLQPRYKDIRKFLLEYKIIEILNLGEEVFEQVVVPTCIIFIQKSDWENNIVKFEDLSDKSKFSGEMNLIHCKAIEQETYKKTSDNIFVGEVRKLKSDEIYLNDIFDFKDAGINYQRVNVGISNKGTSDLSKRLLYEGKKKHHEDVEYWKGSDIDTYFIAPKTLRFVRTETASKLKPNERVILNKEYFKLTPKLIWRQTAEYPIVALDNTGIWFGRSIQAGKIKPEYYPEIDCRYLVSLLNSKYIRHIYVQNVKESGRVFPQVKLEKLRSLPVKKISIVKQKPFIAIVDNILGITKDDDYLQNPAKQAKVCNYEKQIDQLVYKLYGLTPKEIKIVEGKE